MSNTVVPQILINTGKSRLWVVENFTPDYFPILNELILQENPPIEVFNKPGIQHRDVGFFSDTILNFPYSGQIMPARPLMECPIFPSLLPAINASLNLNANGILVNRYRTGKTGHLGQHSDNPRDLDPNNATVASLAYGSTRIFRITDKKTGKKVLDHLHQPRSLLVMDGKFQEEFKHGVPPMASVTEPRISITFRSHR